MPDLTREEAVTFIEAMRLQLADRVGFRWIAEKLSALENYVESISAENARFNAYLDESGRRTEFEAFKDRDQDA